MLVGPADALSPAGTCLVLRPVPDRLAQVSWVGPAAAGVDADDVAGAVGLGQPRTRCTRRPAGQSRSSRRCGTCGKDAPVLSGIALRTPNTAGHDWSPAFRTSAINHRDGGVVVEAVDPAAELALTTEIAAVSGGPLRIRHRLTNAGSLPYVVDSLDVVVPVSDRVGEVVDFTGRWGRERTPQRHPMRDGVWLLESRGGRPGHASATELIVGTAGFGYGTGEVWAVHVAWSGNSRYILERQPSGLVTLGGGELLLPGEIVLGQRARATRRRGCTSSRPTPGWTGSPASCTRYLRALPAHPRWPRPVRVERVGGRVLRPRPGPADPTRRPRRAGRGRTRSSWTTAGSARGATITPASATGSSPSRPGRTG